MSMQRVLIADDDLVIRMILREYLAGLGFDVIEAEDGAAALDLARSERPHFMFLDGRMPRMDGIDVARTIRRDDSLGSIYLVLLSARALRADIERGFEVGVDDYVTKPFDLDDIGVRLQRIIAARNGVGIA